MRTVLVTGIGRGLGREFYTQLATKGYRVFGLLRNREQYEALNAANHARTRLILADLTETSCIGEIRAVVKQTPIDLVINNAGIGGTGMTLEKTSPGELLSLFQVHCLGVLRVMQAIRPNLLAGFSPLVINMNSRLGSITHQYRGTFDFLQVSYSYRIAKAAQNMLTNCLRNEFKDRIEFVSLTPGKVRTAMAQSDADLQPAEAVGNIIDHWEQKKFKAQNGILQVPDDVTEW